MIKVGMKAIIANSKNHSEYNFQMCEIKEIENSKRIYVELHNDGFITNFYVQANEIIPILYENTEDLKKFGTTVDDITKLFSEYKGYYDLICSVADNISHESEEKEEKYKKHIEEMQHHIDRLKSDLAEAQDNKIQLPHEPIKVAEMLIDATETRENCMTGKEYDKPIYEKWQLEQIARHLLVFCGKCEE